jgi:response regulator RpfG family c-di-GMP phosphodiesterase
MNDRMATLVPPVARRRDSAILCVDDEPRVLSALERILGQEPYEILRAEDGDAALDLLDCFPVKVVVADQRMPGMSGAELLSKVRQRWPQIGRIILTGHPGQAILLQSLEEEVDFLMYKPWDDSALKRAIRSLIDAVDRSMSEQGDDDLDRDLGGEGG